MAAFALVEKLDMDGLGGLIQRWMTEQGRSVEDFADEVGCSPRQAYRWSNNEAKPSSRYRRSIAEVLGIDTERLLAVLDSMRVATESEGATGYRSRHTGVTPVSDLNYPTTPEAKLRWASMVRADSSLSRAARDTLQALLADRFLEGTVDASVKAFDELAEATVDYSADEIEAVWDEVLNSGYVERIFPRFEWVLRLKFPKEH
jgi:transcriptional regulator with XRE-family HTH domain